MRSFDVGVSVLSEAKVFLSEFESITGFRTALFRCTYTSKHLHAVLVPWSLMAVDNPYIQRHFGINGCLRSIEDL